MIPGILGTPPRVTPQSGDVQETTSSFWDFYEEDGGFDWGDGSFPGGSEIPSATDPLPPIQPPSHLPELSRLLSDFDSKSSEAWPAIKAQARDQNSKLCGAAVECGLIRRGAKLIPKKGSSKNILSRSKLRALMLHFSSKCPGLSHVTRDEKRVKERMIQWFERHFERLRGYGFL